MYTQENQHPSYPYTSYLRSLRYEGTATGRSYQEWIAYHLSFVQLEVDQLEKKRSERGSLHELEELELSELNEKLFPKL